jgi:predicted acetyltransferase
VNGLTFRPVRPEEVGIAVTQYTGAFGADAGDTGDREAEFRRHLAAGRLWGVDAGGRLVGHCRLRGVDHFFGGRAVRCLEVAGVAVPDEHRRTGVATAMLEGAAAWGSHQNLGLALLFPAVPGLYRRLGWEFAGVFPAASLPTGAQPPAGEPMRLAVAADLPHLAPCHEQYASTLTGPAVRSEQRWRFLLLAEALYVLDGADGLDAYVLLYRGDADAPEEPATPATVYWGATTPRGMRSVAALLARELADRAPIVRGPLPDPLALSAATWDVPAVTGRQWMARTLLVAVAMAGRGFPAAIEADVTFAVADGLVLESSGPWRLQVSRGSGELTPAPSADVVLDARATGPLYTGFRTASQLALAGLLDGPPHAVEVLDALFGGPPPVLLDFF